MHVDADVAIDPVVAWQARIPPLEQQWPLVELEYDPARERFVAGGSTLIGRSGAVEQDPGWYRRSASDVATARRGQVHLPTDDAVAHHLWSHAGGRATLVWERAISTNAHECNQYSYSITTVDATGHRGRQITLGSRPRAAAFAADGSILMSPGRARVQSYQYEHVGVRGEPRWPARDETLRITAEGRVERFSRRGFDLITPSGSQRVWAVVDRSATLLGMRRDGRVFFRKRVRTWMSQPMPTATGVCVVVGTRSSGAQARLAASTGAVGGAILRCFSDDGSALWSRSLFDETSVMTTLDGTTFIGSRRGIDAHDAQGRKLWSLAIPIVSTLTITDAGELCAIADAPLRLFCLRGRADARQR